jgi:anthranilate phosphoribosyltransferase
MAIGKYIKEIGRGKDGARALPRADAADLFGQVLDGAVTDLEIGAFCLAMRIKGETPEEMAGFLDATHARIARIPAPQQGSAAQNGKHVALPTIVIPTYNGARKLPVLTPLLALLLAREGLPVLLHGTATESSRVFTSEVLEALEIPSRTAITSVANGTVQFVRTAVLCPGLQRLLDVRRVVNLRNPAHSLVKLMNPCAGPALLVTSYTHPEYAVSMAETLTLMQTTALLLRGTEGEAVADARRTPKMQAFVNGQAQEPFAAQSGSLSELPDLPTTIDAVSTAAYIRKVLTRELPVPPPIAQQVAHILQLAHSLQNPTP